MTSRLGSGDFDVAADGTLAYVDAPAATYARTLVWVDRQGREEPLALSPRQYLHPRVSPDGTKVAVAGEVLWVWDLARQTPLQLTPGGAQAPVWTQDGRHLIFMGLAWLPADGTGAAEALGRGLPSGVTPDGTRVLFSPPGAVDMMMLALDGTRRVEPLIQTEFAERNGVVSPDGRWLAYESDSSGKLEIYVRPFPIVGTGLSKISTTGGTRPMWSRSGQELFYVAPDGAIMAVPVDPRGVTWSARSPAKVLEGPYLTTGATSARTYDVSPDGKRFLVVKQPPATQATGPQIIVVQNWFEEIKRLVSAPR